MWCRIPCIENLFESKMRTTFQERKLNVFLLKLHKISFCGKIEFYLFKAKCDFSLFDKLDYTKNYCGWNYGGGKTCQHWHNYMFICPPVVIVICNVHVVLDRENPNIFSNVVVTLVYKILDSLKLFTCWGSRQLRFQLSLFGNICPVEEIFICVILTVVHFWQFIIIILFFAL